MKAQMNMNNDINVRNRILANFMTFENSNSFWLDMIYNGRILCK